MKKIIFAAILLFPFSCKAVALELPKDSWISENIIKIEPYLEHKGERFPSFEERKKNEIHLNLIGEGSRELREYRVSKNIKMVVFASVDCGVEFCRLNLHIEILKKRIFLNYITIHDIGALTIIKPRINFEDDSWNGISVLDGVLNLNKDEPPERFGVYCLLVPKNKN
ncbi:MAG: hypothetical protein HZB99_03790 [Candidatus Harrisonbacteria bacterium]|nr:hypothetical protein [Candidatus Harrisonbacteria bacterium]